MLNNNNIFDDDYLFETKKVTLKLKDRTEELEFRALTAQDLFELFHRHSDVFNLLFGGLDQAKDEDITVELFKNYPRAGALILALTVIYDEQNLAKKQAFFNNCDAPFAVEALNAVFELTFKSGVAETIKKLKADLTSILTTFYSAKSEPTAL